MASRHVSRGDTGDRCDRSHDCHVSAVTTPARREEGGAALQERSDTIGKYGQAFSPGCIVYCGASA